MDTTLLMLSFFFGTVGTGYFIYGKNTGRLIPMVAGGSLVAVPYFITSALILVLFGVACSAAPWFIHES